MVRVASVRGLRCALLALAALWVPAPAARAERVAVRHAEGRIRGFLTLRDLDGELLAVGDLTQLANGASVTSTLRFHFKDGSLHDETAVFSQRREFRLLAYRLVQSGPAFERQLDLAVDAKRGEVTIRHSEGGAEEKTIRERLKLPDDLANGLVTTLLADLDPAAPETSVSLLAAAPKPRVVKLEIAPRGEDEFAIAGSPFQASHFEIHVEIGGLAGAVAPLLGKQPPNTHVWMSRGKAPGFLRSEGPLFEGGPVWRIELASPTWPAKDSGAGQ